MNLLAPELATLDLEKLMAEALHEAEAAGQAGEIPLGAVIMLNGKIIARGRARQQEYRSQIRHAELNTLLCACEELWTEYKHAMLFTTVEPCPMCLGAVVMADIPHIIFAKLDLNVQSRFNVESNPYIRRHIKNYYGGVLEVEATQLLAGYKPLDLNVIESSGQASEKL
jgi:tRNA(adenine34) deaminase